MNIQAVPSTSLQVEQDPDLNTPDTNVPVCLERFYAKGGTLHVITDNSPRFTLLPGAYIYPICSAGACRSQALWGHLKKNFDGRITVFPPHAANRGWDPYNGRINRDRNHPETAVEAAGFTQHFGFEKARRAGFENNDIWEAFGKSPGQDQLQKIRDYYNKHYWGGTSDGCTIRVYIAFMHNAHIALKRLDEANSDLKNVVVVALNVADLISTPPVQSVGRRTKEAYAHFEKLLVEKYIDTSQL